MHSHRGVAMMHLLLLLFRFRYHRRRIVLGPCLGRRHAEAPVTVTHVDERDAASLVILSGGCGGRRGLIELTARRLKEKENREYRSLSPCAA